MCICLKTGFMETKLDISYMTMLALPYLLVDFSGFISGPNYGFSGTFKDFLLIKSERSKYFQTSCHVVTFPIK